MLCLHTLLLPNVISDVCITLLKTNIDTMTLCVSMLPLLEKTSEDSRLLPGSYLKLNVHNLYVSR